MPLIDSTYFNNDINIPTGINSNLDQYIARYEPEFLKRIFGYELYVLIAAYDTTKTPKHNEQRIIDIIEGKEFTEGQFTYKWNGLKNTDFISPIAYYVYYQNQKSKVTHTSTGGEKKNTSPNYEAIDASFKVKNAWMQMCRLIGSPWDYQIDSLYYFMSQNAAIYPEWNPTYFKNINSFDI